MLVFQVFNFYSELFTQVTPKVGIVVKQKIKRYQVLDSQSTPFDSQESIECKVTQLMLTY